MIGRARSAACREKTMPRPARASSGSTMPHLGERRRQRLPPRLGEPHDDGMVRRPRVDLFGRAPGVRKVRAKQHQVAVVIGRDRVADIALAAAVQRQRQLEFGVVVPLEGDAVVEPPVEQRPGRALRHGDLFEQRAHRVLTLDRRSEELETPFQYQFLQGTPTSPEMQRVCPAARNTGWRGQHDDDHRSQLEPSRRCRRPAPAPFQHPPRTASIAANAASAATLARLFDAAGESTDDAVRIEISRPARRD